MSANKRVSLPAGGLDNNQKISHGDQLSTVFEVPRSRHGIEKDLQDFAMVNGASDSIHAHPVRDSHENSPGSSVGQIYSEKLRERSPRVQGYRDSAVGPQGRRPSTKNESLRHNGQTRISTIDPSNPPSTKKRKKSGLGTVIRRLFGRRTVKNRISLPAPTENGHNVRPFVTASQST